MSNTTFLEPNASAPPYETVQLNALESIERASIDMQISTAKRYPRTLSVVKADMLSFATLDEETASGCFYTLPRGGKTIQGPSVRLAEIALACYGNLRAGSRVISVVTEGSEPHVVIQAVAHDLQRNVAITIEKRRRITKKKNKDRIDEDDINLAANAGSSIAFRDAVFKVVPLALVKPVYEQAKQVAVGDVKSLSKRRGQVVDRLKQMGATEERILAAVGAAKIEDIDQGKIETLIGLGTALKDGDTTLEEAFPMVNSKPKSQENVISKVETKPAAEEKAKDPHAELEAFLEEHGFSMNMLQIWGEDSGNIEKADTYATVRDIPVETVTRLLKAKPGLKAGLELVKGGMAR